MSRLTSRSRLAAAVSPLAFGIALCAGGSAAWAQDTQTATDPNASAATTQDATPAQDTTDQTDQKAPEGAIVVTGFRASLQSATATKKRSDQIVESVSAEDIPTTRSRSRSRVSRVWPRSGTRAAQPSSRSAASAPISPLRR